MRLEDMEADREGVTEEMVVHDKKNKGTLATFEGPQNSGKSSLMLHFAEAQVEDRDECVVWRGFRDASWHRYPGDHDNIRILIQNRIDVEFTRAKPRQTERAWDPFPYPVVRFKDAKDLLRKADFGKFNVVYAQEHRHVPKENGDGMHKQRTGFWHDVIKELREKPIEAPHDLYIDDMMDLWPLIQRGTDHHSIEEIFEELGQFRKNWNSLYGAVHERSDAHWLLDNKMQGYAWMVGSTPHSKAATPQRFAKKYTRKVKGEYAVCILEHYNSYTTFAYPDTPSEYDVTAHRSVRNAFESREVLTPTTTIRGVPLAILRLLARDEVSARAIARDPTLPSHQTIGRALDDYKTNHPDDYRAHKRGEQPAEAGGPDHTPLPA